MHSFVSNLQNSPFVATEFHFSGLVEGVKLIQAKARAGKAAQHKRKSPRQPLPHLHPHSSLSLRFGMGNSKAGLWKDVGSVTQLLLQGSGDRAVPAQGPSALQNKEGVTF